MIKSYRNNNRPPVYCPGCTHQNITTALDSAMISLDLDAEKTVLVTDIGCSGLFDTFFNVHALHGTHGRALAYATGLKLADPELHVIVTMGDGGLGIGAAHVLAACRRNLDLTLIILNNFNFGMTGGQYSVTTPTDSLAGSSFLNRAEIPIDICAIAESAGATFVARTSGLNSELADTLAQGVCHQGFSIIETLGLCTGRYTNKNGLTPKVLEQMVAELPPQNGRVERNQRPEYGEHYRFLSKESAAFPEPVAVEIKFAPTSNQRQEILILGSAGMRIVTAGELVSYAGLSCGMNVSMKSDYTITVLRGHSISEITLSSETIGYTGTLSPTIVLALSNEGVQQRMRCITDLEPEALVVKENSVTLPATSAIVIEVDFQKAKIVQQSWALAALSLMAKKERGINRPMLEIALKQRFQGKAYVSSLGILELIFSSNM